MALDVSGLQAQVDRVVAHSAQIKTALDALKANGDAQKKSIDDLTKQLANAGVDPATLSALSAMQNTLQSSEDIVDAALAADSPPPAPAPAPTPTP